MERRTWRHASGRLRYFYSSFLANGRDDRSAAQLSGPRQGIAFSAAWDHEVGVVRTSEGGRSDHTHRVRPDSPQLGTESKPSRSLGEIADDAC